MKTEKLCPEGHKLDYGIRLEKYDHIYCPACGIFYSESTECISHDDIDEDQCTAREVEGE